MAFGGTNSPAVDDTFSLRRFIEGETGGDVIDDMAPVRSKIEKPAASIDLGWGLGKHLGMYPMRNPGK